MDYVCCYAFRDLVDGRAGTIEKDGTTIYWNEVARRDTGGSYRVVYDHPQLGDGNRSLRFQFFHRYAAATDRTVEAVEAEFRCKHRYVQYPHREGVTDSQ